MTSLNRLIALSADRQSEDVTNWAARIGWIVGLLLFVVLVYWLMREGWKWRGTLQRALPEPLPVPAPATTLEDGADPALTLAGRYHGSTTAGQWLDRIVAHGLGTRSRAELTLTEQGLTVLRPGARDFHIPATALRGARLDAGIAGKVLAEGGLLVVTWQLGDTLLDSGFRGDRAAEHPPFVARINRLSGDSAVAVQHDQEGAR